MIVELVERATAHWKTSAAGIGLGAAIWYALNSWHCQLPTDSIDWIKWASTAGPVILGLLSKDR